MARRKKSNKPKEAPYLNEHAMTKVAEGLVELVMGMITGKELETDNKEKHIDGKHTNSCSRCNDEHKTDI